MSHGAGGKASRRLVEGLIAPLLANPVLAKLSDAAAFALGRDARRDDGRWIRRASAAISGRIDRRNRRQRDGQRPGCLGRAGARADGDLDPRGGSADRDLAGGGRGDGARGGACRRRDRRRRHEGRRARTVRRHVRHDVRDRRRRRAVDARCALGAARRPGAAQRTGRRPWDHDPARTRRVATRGRSPLGHALGVAVRRGADRGVCGERAVDARSDARRRRDRVKRGGAGRRVRDRHRRGRDPAARPRPRRVRNTRTRPVAYRERRAIHRDRRAGRRGPRARGAACDAGRRRER